MSSFGNDIDGEIFEYFFNDTAAANTSLSTSQKNPSNNGSTNDLPSSEPAAKRKIPVVSEIDILKQKMNGPQSEDYYPRLGRRRFFYTKTTPNFMLNPPTHYVVMPNSDWRFNVFTTLGNYEKHGNMAAFAKFVEEHCVPDYQVVHQFDGTNYIYGPDNRVTVGVKRVIELFSMYAFTSPDRVSVIEDVMGWVDPKTGAAFCSCREISSYTRMNMIKDTDAYVEDLVQKMNEIKLEIAEVAQKSEGNVAIVDETQEMSDMECSKLTKKVELFTDIKRTLNEKIAEGKVEKDVFANSGSGDSSSSSNNEQTDKTNETTGQKVTIFPPYVLSQPNKPIEKPRFVLEKAPTLPVTSKGTTTKHYGIKINTIEFNTEGKMIKGGVFFKEV